MVLPAATDVDPDTLRQSGHWALYWEVVHARGSRIVVEAAWADLTEDELPDARAGYEAARQARQARFSERLRAKTLARLADDSDREYVDDPLAYAQQLVNEQVTDRR
jgi:hypothetical protein